MLIGTQRKSATQTHHAAGISFDKNCGDTATGSRFWLGQGTRNFLAYDEAPQRRRNDRFDGGVREKRRKSATQLFSVTGILQDERALHIGAAVQAAGKLEMPVPNGPRDLEHAQQLFVLQHKSPATTSAQSRWPRL